MGMKHMNKMWGMTGNQKVQGNPQSGHWGQPMTDGGVIGGNAKRPLMIKQNMAGNQTPRFVGPNEGNSATLGTGSGKTDTWKPHALK